MAGLMREVAASEATSTAVTGTSQEGRPAGVEGLTGRCSGVLAPVVWLVSAMASPAARTRRAQGLVGTGGLAPREEAACAWLHPRHKMHPPATALPALLLLALAGPDTAHCPATPHPAWSPVGWR